MVEKTKLLILIHDKTTGTFRKKIIKENHITVTEELRGRYLTHYTPKPKSGTSKPAKQCAIGLFNWLMERGKDLNLQLICSDTTNEMSGWKGGMIHFCGRTSQSKTF